MAGGACPRMNCVNAPGETGVADCGGSADFGREKRSVGPPDCGHGDVSGVENDGKVPGASCCCMGLAENGVPGAGFSTPKAWVNEDGSRASKPALGALKNLVNSPASFPPAVWAGG